MKPKKIKDLKNGTWFKRTETTAKTYTRGHYERWAKRYSCTDHDNINREIFLPGDTFVFVDFTY